MSSEAFAIRVTDVTKRYMMYARPEDRLKQSVVPRLERLIGRPPTKFYKDFDALHGVSFEVGRGETVGIIGRNGSGKSTLLQVICGTLTPTSGTVEVRGRIAALLELGAGFNPEFSGRENVYMNAAILGLSREETDSRFEAITKFADIGDFLEHPVKTYSSGMFVRLAFAVAINVDPDILVVDEALSVGDEAFQRKCFARIEQIKDRGATILFVSHGAQTIVQLCDRAILMDGGEKLLDGAPKPVVSQYQRLINLTKEEAPPVREEIRNLNGRADILGLEDSQEGHTRNPDAIRPTNQLGMPDIPADGCKPAVSQGWLDASLASQTTVFYEGNHATIRDVRLLTHDRQQVNVLVRGKRYLYQYEVDFKSPATMLSFGMLFRSVAGLDLAGASDEVLNKRLISTAAVGDTLRIEFDFECRLMPASYFANAGVMGMVGGERRYLHRILDAIAFRVVDHEATLTTGFFDLDHSLRIIPVDRYGEEVAWARSA